MTTTTDPAPVRAGSGFWRTFVSVFGIGILLCIIGLALVLQVVPRLMGGASLTVLTGSMEPTLKPGDVIAVRAADPAEIDVGDIVTFQPVSGDPTLVTHRVIGVGFNSIGGRTFTTQGDANGAADAPIDGEQVNGVYLYRVPYLGYGLALVGENAPLLASIAGILLIGYAIFAFVRPRRRTRAGGAAIVVILTVAATWAHPPPAGADELDVPFAGPTVHLDWQGEIYTTIEPSFFGERIVVPGDLIGRQVRITNAGPTAGVVSVRLVDVVQAGSGDLAERLALEWAVSDEQAGLSFARAADGTSLVADGIPLARGQSRLFTLWLRYPDAATGGMAASAGRTVVSFDVEFVIREVAPAEPEGPTPFLPGTGGVGALGALVGGLALLSAGLALLLVRRRRSSR